MLVEFEATSRRTGKRLGSDWRDTNDPEKTLAWLRAKTNWWDWKIKGLPEPQPDAVVEGKP
jgi:hypothetical protein